MKSRVLVRELVSGHTHDVAHGTLVVPLRKSKPPPSIHDAPEYAAPTAPVETFVEGDHVALEIEGGYVACEVLSTPSG